LFVPQKYFSRLNAFYANNVFLYNNEVFVQTSVKLFVIAIGSERERLVTLISETTLFLLFDSIQRPLDFPASERKRFFHLFSSYVNAFLMLACELQYFQEWLHQSAGKPILYER